MTYPPQQPGAGPYGPPPGPYGPQGQPGQYGPPSPYGYVGPPPPPSRRRTGLVVGAAIGVLVLVGAGVGAYYLFLRPNNAQAGGNASPQQVVAGFAQSYTSLAHTLSTDDLARVKGYLCTTDQQAMQVIYDHQKALHDTDRSFAMRASDARVTGTQGTFMIVIVDRGTSSRPRVGKLVRQSQGWLVCDTVSPPG